MTNKSVRIVVATHKAYQMPTDSMYLPLHVGAKGKTYLGYRRDYTGEEHISEKNPGFCELTGLYWAWKNLGDDFIGLVHYRRYFCLKKGRRDEWMNHVLTYPELEPMLHLYKVFVPKKRNYYIETLYSHYAHTHYAFQLDCVREIIAEKYPEYLKSYDKVLKRSWGHMFNMFIMQNDYLDAYCTWVFDILFELERRLPSSENLSDFQKRLYGRISEIIFNVWLQEEIDSGRMKKSEIKELPCLHLEKINWFKKGGAFLCAKIFKKKYERGF